MGCRGHDWRHQIDPRRANGGRVFSGQLVVEQGWGAGEINWLCQHSHEADQLAVSRQPRYNTRVGRDGQDVKVALMRLAHQQRDERGMERGAHARHHHRGHGVEPGRGPHIFDHLYQDLVGVVALTKKPAVERRHPPIAIPVGHSGQARQRSHSPSRAPE